MKSPKQNLLIGQVAARTGVAVSALRFYEEAGLISAGRNSGGRRVFAKAGGVDGSCPRRRNAP